MMSGSIVDYNDRSFVVKDAPSEIWEDLFKLGGLFSNRLKNDIGHGWVFSKKKKEVVETFLEKYEPVSEESITETTATATTTKEVLSTRDIRRIFSDLKENFEEGEEYEGIDIITIINTAQKRLINLVKQ